MTILSWIIGIPVAVAVVLFALSNRQDVAIGLWPLEGGFLIPAYLLALVPLLAGILLGTVSAGIKGLGLRRAARGHAKRAAALERELESLKGKTPDDPAVKSTAPGAPEAP